MKTIGRTDIVDFPEFELVDLPVKIDTGAYGCALHCSHMRVIVRDGKETLEFRVLDPSHPDFMNKLFYARDYSMKKVKSSVGISEERFAIKTDLVIFKKKYKVVFTLTDRGEMKYPVLLGRKFLKNRFAVDVAQKDISYNSKRI